MSVKLVTYDINSPGQDYASLYERIESLGPTLHVLESVWLVETTKTVGAVTEVVRGSADNNDSFLVVDISSAPRQGWLPQEYWDWINARV